MNNRTEFLMFGRRLHNALRHAIEDGDGRTDDRWIQQERPLFEHYACGMYLSGVIAYLEDQYGARPWNAQGAAATDFDAFVAGSPAERFRSEKIGKVGCEALVCIRNAVIHNGGDLSKNRDPTSEAQVRSANLSGVQMNGAVVRLVSSSQVDFMEYVRLSLVAVAQYHGDG